MNQAVCATDLSVGYAHQALVENLNFTLESGTSLALVGTNGSGKTTLLRSIVGLLPIVSGGLSILERTPGGSPKSVAYVSQYHQSSTTLPLQAGDVVWMGRYANLGLWRRPSREDRTLVEHSMSRMGIAHLTHEPLRVLSGGQQQRVYLAQALARHADVLVLDEPTAGLDAGAQELTRQALATEIGRGAAVITATHDFADATMCDFVMLLARRVVAFGTPEEVLTPENLMETFGIMVRTEGGIVPTEHPHGHDHP